MGKAAFRIASDGLSARDADTWSEEKLMILACYLDGFADACKKAGGWYGLDLFAGTGLNYSVTRQHEIPGSPLIALEAGKPEATQVIAAEQNTRARQALEARVASYGDRATVFPSDANRAVSEMLGLIPKKAPAFAFLDPEGSELDWATVEAIADYKRGEKWKVEQLILLPTDMGVVRLMRDYPEKLTRVFGHEDWRKIYEARQAEKMSADEARGEYVELYAEGLRGLGYDIVLDRQIVKSTGHPMYFLIFATDHSAGQTIMDHCFDRVRIRLQEELGQTTLFPTKEGPRRRRLSDQ